MQQKVKDTSSKSPEVEDNQQLLLEVCTVVGSGAVGAVLGVADDVFIGRRGGSWQICCITLMNASE